MACACVLCPEVLTSEEYNGINENVRFKIEDHVKKLMDERDVEKAANFVNKQKYEKTIADLTNNVGTKGSELQELKERFDSANQELEITKAKLQDLQLQANELNDSVQRLESENTSYRHTRDVAVDERDELIKALDRRCAEIERAKEEIKTQDIQLKSAIAAKCEALLKVEEVKSLEMNLEFREKRMEQEKQMLKAEIESLSGELKSRNDEVMNLRRDNINRHLTLDAQLSAKTNELKIATDTIKELEANKAQIQAKLEESLRKIMANHEIEQSLQTTFDAESKQLNKVIELYKEMNEDKEVKINEFQKAMKDLQDKVNKSTERAEAAETQVKTLESEYEAKLEERAVAIIELKAEVEKANQLIESMRRERLETAVENLSPAAASISRLVNSGMTLTQLYMQWANVAEELLVEKKQTQELNDCILAIVQEVESKAPEVQQLRTDHQDALNRLEQLCHSLDVCSQEKINLQQELGEVKRAKEHCETELERHKVQVLDLSRQVSHLLKELEEGQHQESSEPEADDEVSSLVSSKVISRHLVTFNNIEEMQRTNLKLLTLVRELSGKAEQDEQKLEGHEDDKVALEVCEIDLKDARERLDRCTIMMERALQQMRIYKLENIALKEDMRKLLMNEGPGKLKNKEEMKTHDAFEGFGMSSGPCIVSVSSVKEAKEMEELKNKLEKTEKALKELQEESDTYREQRQTNERMLTEQIERMRNELHELRMNSSKVVSQLEYSNERFKILQANCNTYKNQISALEGKNKNYNSTIIKHESTILHMQEDLLNTKKKLSRAEVSLENSRRECGILKDSEARLQREVEVLQRGLQGQSVLLANLELVRAHLTRTDVEGRAKLEEQIQETGRECNTLRRRLLEEQDKYKLLSSEYERDLKKCQDRLAEEKELGGRSKEQLNSVKEKLAEAKSEIEKLNKQMCDSKNSFSDGQKAAELKSCETKIKELERELKKKEVQLNSLESRLQQEKEHSKRFAAISEAMESKLNTITTEYTSYKEASEFRIAEAVQKELEYTGKISALEAQISSLQSGSNQSSAQLSALLQKTQGELTAAKSELDKTKHDLSEAEQEVAKLSSALQTTEDKYLQEVALHSAALQDLMNVKKDLTTLSTNIANLNCAKTNAEDALELGKKGWEEREQKLQSDLTKAEQQIVELQEQNTILLEQIEGLGTKLGVLQVMGGTSAQPSPNTSLNEDVANLSNISNVSLTSSVSDDVKSADQLLQILKYMRMEKNLALNKYELLRTENSRMKSQLENMKKEVEEAKTKLHEERESTDISTLATVKQTEVLDKVETLSAMKDSNRVLRADRDHLVVEAKELQQKVETLQDDLGPLREKNKELSARVQAMDVENSALRGEAARLRQRVNFLIERSSKTSPEDWRRLQQERENLARQVAADQQIAQRKEEETRALRQEKARLEEQINKQGDELNSVQQRITRLTQELNETKALANKKNEELAKITENLGAKEALLTDVRNKEVQVRKIAKKYKTQWEELSKISEADKRRLEELEKTAMEVKTPSVSGTQPHEIPPEVQEQLREEGRREVENRISEAETRHSDKVKELVDKVTSSHEEAESLRKENDTLKVTSADKEERAKTLLKQARSKISQLQENNTMLNEKLKISEARNKVLEQSAEEESVRTSALKSQYDNRISRLENENADLRAEKQREVDTYNQRVSHLQRQLEKYQGTKPTTSSSAGEKTTSEPPTANIKPMAGPSSSGVKQSPNQQSVTVTPWAGRSDTPFASIRPMSMQSRTVAVLPTSQSASSTLSPATPVLVPPQQQLVHTTGSSSSGGPDGLSSSPTSSLSDFIPVPATSSPNSGSSAVRQVAVPPTVTTVSPSTREEPPQSAQSVAESTQDMEAEPAVSDASPQAGGIQQQPCAPLDKVEPQAQQTQQQLQPQQQVPQQQTQSQTLAASGTSQSVTPSTPQQGQQVVAMVLPRVEQQLPSGTSQSPQQVEQAAAAPSSQASTSSNTVTTSQAGVTGKRAREEGDSDIPEDGKSQGKRTRLGNQQDMFPASSDSGLEVEYQVPTSSQRDQEDDMGDSEEDGAADDGVSGLLACGTRASKCEVEEPDDGHEFDEDADNTDGYVVGNYRDETDLTSFEEGEGPDIDEDNQQDPDDNEVEVIGAEESSEVPNQSEPPAVPAQQHAEASSSGTSSGPLEINSARTGVAFRESMARAPPRIIPPLTRQQHHQQSQLMLTYEESGDDSIVPSTPTLFVPRRSDGFGEAVSSPQVPQTRFTFTETNPPATRAGESQASEGIDDSRMDLNQLEEAGTGRSVPTTPPQVSPQESVEVGQSEPTIEATVQQSEPPAEASGSQTTVPSITVTEASEEETAEATEEMPPPEHAEFDETAEQRDSTGEQSSEQDEGLELADESGDGVSSEGEKSQPMEEVEEGREAEATSETPEVPEPPRRMTTRAANSSRRTPRNPYRGQRGQRGMRPTPIVWNEPGSSMASQSPRGRACLLPSMRGSPGDQMRGFPRGGQRARGRARGKPKNSFNPYQMRF